MKKLNPDACQHPVYDGPLRTKEGKMPTDQWGHYFALHQGELHDPPDYHKLWCGIDWSIGLLELNNGNWLARPTREVLEYTVKSIQYPNREAALRAAVAKVIRMARVRARWSDEERYGSNYPAVRAPVGWKLTPEQAQSIITWATGLLGQPAPVLRVTPPPPPPPAPLPLGQLEMF